VRLSAFAADSAGELDILGHDGDALGVNRAQVGVFEQTHQIRLRRFLQRANGSRLKPQIRLEILSDLPDETLERQLADQQLRRLLVSADFTQSDGSRSVAVRLLDAAGGRGALSGRLGSQLLPRGFATSRLTGRLLRTRHFLTDFSLTLQSGFLFVPDHSALTHKKNVIMSENRVK